MSIKDAETYLMVVLEISTKVRWGSCRGSRFNPCRTRIGKCKEHIRVTVKHIEGDYCPWWEHSNFWKRFGLDKEEHGSVLLKLIREEEQNI